MFEKIKNLKKEWIEEGYIGGAIACDCLLMKEQNLDIVYDSENELVQEYSSLLKKRLEAENTSLLLMATVEIEKCMMPIGEDLNRKLCDEAYKHFEDNGKEYPLQLVGLHIDVIIALFSLNEYKKAYNYLYMIEKMYKDNFGDKSYLFSRNWIYILNEVLVEFVPDAAIKEFEENHELFLSLLREELILYVTYMCIARKRTIREKNTHYLKKSIEVCENWCKDIPKKKEFQRWIYSSGAMYYRNIGEYDLAIETFWEAMKFAEDMSYKLFLLAQIASILYAMGETKKLKKFFDDQRGLMENCQETDKDLAELYNLLGAYYMKEGRYRDANIAMDKAIRISEKIEGEKSDLTIKLKCNKLSLQYHSGRYGEWRTEIEKLSRIVSEDFKKYSQSMPFVFNNQLVMSLGGWSTVKMASGMKNILKKKHTNDDILSDIIIKSNLYISLMTNNDSQEEETKELIELKQELRDYFKSYPHSEGFLL